MHEMIIYTSLRHKDVYDHVLFYRLTMYELEVPIDNNWENKYSTYCKKNIDFSGTF